MRAHDRSHGRHVVQCPERVARGAHRNQARAHIEQVRQRVEPQAAVVRIEVEPADLHAPIFRDRKPGSDIGVVIEPRDDEIVARRPVACQRARDGEGERGHVRSEGNFVRSAAEQVGHRLMGFRTQSIDRTRCRERAARVGGAGGEVRDHALDRGRADLRSAGRVEEGTMTERGKTRPNFVDRKAHTLLFHQRSWSCKWLWIAHHESLERLTFPGLAVSRPSYVATRQCIGRADLSAAIER